MNVRPMGTAADWQDSVADWAQTHQKVSEAELDRFIADRDPVPPVPAECCTELGADVAPRNLSGFPLEPLFARYAWLGPVMVACVVVVWLCIDSYLEMTP